MNQGCGICGGVGCGSLDMALVVPTVKGDVPEHAKSSAYCCTSGVDDKVVICGTEEEEGYPPCLIPAPSFEILKSGMITHFGRRRPGRLFCCCVLLVSEEAVVFGSLVSGDMMLVFYCIRC